jgi:phosphoenolpyruvate carboxykinase (ATP)
MVNAALDGKLDDVPTWQEPTFGFHVPEACPGVPAELLNPRSSWQDSAAYDAQAAKLAMMFHDNFKTYAEEVSAAVGQAGPRTA